MKEIFIFIFLMNLYSCSSVKKDFRPEKVCSIEALKYLKNPRNKNKNFFPDPKLIRKMAQTTKSMQLCYEDFRNRSGPEEFNTCLVVGIDNSGKTEFFNFGPKEAGLDETFMKCGRSVIEKVSFSSFGKNYILIQSYEFYTKGL